MSVLKCPKCKTGYIHFSKYDVNKMGLKILNPYYKCLICGWVGFETNQMCRRCKKGKIIRGGNILFCIGCNCFALNLVGNEISMPNIKKLK